MEFLKSWKFAMIVFVVLCVAAVGGVAYGVLTHREAGFMEQGYPWAERTAYPLNVCVHSYPLVGLLDRPGYRRIATADDEVHAANLTDAINQRLGVTMFRVSPNAAGICDILIVYDVPSGVDDQDAIVEPGGYAVVRPGQCEIGLSNVTGELKSLTLYHELGHCLGLDHDDQETSIMRRVQRPTPPGQYPPMISDSDRALLLEAYNGRNRG